MEFTTIVASISDIKTTTAPHDGDMRSGKTERLKRQCASGSGRICTLKTFG
jgi:hypothetical protein